MDLKGVTKVKHVIDVLSKLNPDMAVCSFDCEGELSYACVSLDQDCVNYLQGERLVEEEYCLIASQPADVGLCIAHGDECLA